MSNYIAAQATYLAALFNTLSLNPMRDFAWIVLASLFFSFSSAQDTIITFSYESGYYTTPFELTLTSSVASTEIQYTLDGSDPKNSESGVTLASPLSISIDTDDTTGRGLTPGVVVRAVIKNGDQFLGHSQCKSYIFTDKLSTQKDPGGDWPDEDYRSINSHNIDYAIDSAIVYDSAYADLIDPSLLSLPVISISTDLSNLFDPDTGIYVNSGQRGEEWERECSFEIFNVDNTQEFQINAGIRLKGGWSRQVFNPKYSFRVLFKEEYGPKKLEYSFFGEEGASSFKHMELRTEQNCGYNLDGGIAHRNTFLRDIFARDAQRDMKWPYIRSEYYHLYVNGMYWGIYMTHERINEDYGKSYFGGDKDNYDIIKATDLINGSFNAWRDLWTLCDNGFVSNEDYFRLIGKDANGKSVRGSEIYCDIDNLIDYMALVFYTGNFDGPASKWGSNRSASNFIALTDRSDKSFGFKFFAVDFEYAMMVEPIYIGIGLNENRVNIGYPGANPLMNMPDFNQFNPQWLHHKLSGNREYRMRFIDRVYYLFEENGELTPSKSASRMEERRVQIDTAIIAETARWGDAQMDSNLVMTKEIWEYEVSLLMNEFFPARTDIVIQQLRDVDLYSDLLPPQITVSGVMPADEHYYLAGEEEISVINTNASGNLYYTTNGKDPRLIDGEVAAYALEATGGSEVFMCQNSMIIMARVKEADEWSPIRTKKILAPVTLEEYSYLKVTELNYNPLPRTLAEGLVPGSDYEFIEFKNTGVNALNISGVHLDSAVNYSVPENTILLPGEYFVVSDKPKYLYDRYGFVASGNFTGNFANSGEYVLLEDSMDNEILSFTYSNQDPWPELADGYTLTSAEIDPTGDPDIPEYWTSSPGVHGNPFLDTSIIVLGIPEELAMEFTVYPNPTNEFLYVEATEKSTSISVVSIYNLMGSLVYQEKFDGTIEISLDGMNVQPGIYIVSIRNGAAIRSEKVIYY